MLPVIHVVFKMAPMSRGKTRNATKSSKTHGRSKTKKAKDKVKQKTTISKLVQDKIDGINEEFAKVHPLLLQWKETRPEDGQNNFQQKSVRKCLYLYAI